MKTLNIVKYCSKVKDVSQLLKYVICVYTLTIIVNSLL